MVETFILLFFLLTEVKDGLLIVVVQICDEERFKLLAISTIFYIPNLPHASTEIKKEGLHLPHIYLTVFILKTTPSTHKAVK